MSSADILESVGSTESKLVSKRLYQLEIKLDAVLSWIKNEYGDQHAIFQMIRASCVGKTNLKRGHSRGPPSDDLTQNPFVVICKADQLRCREPRKRRIRSNDSDKEIIELSENTDCGNNNTCSSVPGPNERELPSTATADQLVQICEIKTESIEADLSNYQWEEEDQFQDTVFHNSNASSDFNYSHSSESSSSTSSSMLKRNSLDEDQVTHERVSTLALGHDTVEVVKEEPNKCSICNKLFVTRHNLKVHYETVHMNRKSFECSQCGKTFSRKDNLERHQTSKLKPCFRKEKQVTKSITRTTREPGLLFPCETCNKVYNSLKYLRSHQEITHLGLKPHMCSVCGKCFGRLGDLKDHVDLHSDAPNYKCPYCDKVFRLRRTMEQHRKRHLGASKKQCTLCGKILVNAVSLQKHIEVVHEGVRRYPCSICDKKFTTWSSRNYHQKTHSNPNTKYRGLNKIVGPRLRKNDTAGKHFIRQVEPDEVERAGNRATSNVKSLVNDTPSFEENDQKHFASIATQ